MSDAAPRLHAEGARSASEQWERGGRPTAARGASFRGLTDPSSQHRRRSEGVLGGVWF